MPENPSAHFVLHLHGPCIICLSPLDLSRREEICLLKKDGAFARFGDRGEMTVSDSSLIWYHAAHLQ